MHFDLDYLLRRNDTYREYSNFFWLLLLLLFVPFYCAYQVSDKNAEGRYKVKIKLEGFVVSVDSYTENCEIMLRNYEDDEVYFITIKQSILDDLSELETEQLVKVNGYLPSKYKENTVIALKVKIQ